MIVGTMARALSVRGGDDDDQMIIGIPHEYLVMVVKNIVYL